MKEDALTVRADGAAKLCGISRGQWFKLKKDGRVPKPILLGKRCPFWLVSELRDWLAAGCPPQNEWELIKHPQVRPLQQRIDVPIYRG